MKIQEIKETKRKVILWSVIVVMGVVLFFWWGKGVIETLQDISFPEVSKEFKENIQQTKEEFTFPAFKEIEIPEEVLQELKEYEQAKGQ